MSTLQATNLKHESSASNNIVLDASGNTTISGSATITGALQANGVTGSLYPLVSGTAQASTSGTSVDFTGLPSWVKRVTVMFSGVSTNGTSPVIVQIGSSSGLQTTGYLGSASIQAVGTTLYTAGLGIESAGIATSVRNGQAVISGVGSNVWAMNAVLARSDAAFTLLGASSVTLSGALDRVRITTVGGTDTFDAGSINILYEG